MRVWTTTYRPLAPTRASPNPLGWPLECPFEPASIVVSEQTDSAIVRAYRAYLMGSPPAVAARLTAGRVNVKRSFAEEQHTTALARVRELARAVVHAAGLFNHTRSTLDFVHAAASVHDVDNLIDSRRRSGTGRKSHLLLCRAKT